MKCTYCGNLASDSAQFCNRCGRPLAMGVHAATASAGTLALEGVSSGASRGAGAAGGSTNTGGAAAVLLERAKNILLSPRSEWSRIAGEPSSIADLYLRYALPLFLAVAVLSFLHLSVIGASTFLGGTLRMPMTVGLTSALYTVVGGAVGLGLVSLIINMLAPTFGAQRDLRQAFKVAVYTATPSCVASVFSLLPAFGTLLALVAMVYGIYLLYLGLIPVMQTPKERAVGYTATIIIVTIVLSILLGVLLGTVGGFSRSRGFNATGGAASATSRDESAAAVGNAIGSALGSDEKGKSDLGAAIANLAKQGAQSESTPAAAPTTAGSVGGGDTQTAQNTGAAVGGLLSALGGSLNGGRRVEPVSYAVLKGLLPQSLPNMQRISAEGSAKQGLGIKATSSTAVYSGANGARVEIEIADASAVAGLMNLAEELPQTTSGSSDTGYEKDVTISGYPAHEKYDASSQHGELTFLLVKRFTVGLTGDHVDMATLESDAGRVDFGKLTAMKDAGAR
jgi:hypothetical protein